MHKHHNPLQQQQQAAQQQQQGVGLTNGQQQKNNGPDDNNTSSMPTVFTNFVNSFAMESPTPASQQNQQQQQAMQRSFMDSVSPVNVPSPNNPITTSPNTQPSSINNETTNYWGQTNASVTEQPELKNSNNGNMFMMNGGGGATNNNNAFRNSQNHSPIQQQQQQPNAFTLFNEQSIESLTGSQSPSPHTLPLSHTPPAGQQSFLRPFPVVPNNNNKPPVSSPSTKVARDWTGSAGNSPQRPLPGTSNFLASGRARVTSTNSNISNSSSQGGGGKDGSGGIGGTIGQPTNLMTKLNTNMQSTQRNSTSGFNQYNTTHDNFFDNKHPTPASTPPISSTSHHYNNSTSNSSSHHPHQHPHQTPPAATATTTSNPMSSSFHQSMTQSTSSPIASSQNNHQQHHHTPTTATTTSYQMQRSNSIPNTKPIQQQHKPPPGKSKPHRYRDHPTHHRHLTDLGRTNLDQSKWYSLKIEGNVRNISPVLWKFHHLTKLDMRGNIIRKLPNEVSHLRNLIQLDVSRNLLKTLPNTLGDMSELRELNVSHNKINTLPVSIGRLFNLQSLSIENNFIDQQYVNCLKRDNGLRVLMDHLLDQYINQPNNYDSLFDKPHRDWKQLTDNMGMYEVHPISVMTYNILSDKYATTQQYGYCPSWALQWEYRRDKLLEEIQQYSPDIICLQEIEKGVYNRDFKTFLSELNYSGVYSQKGRARTMYADQQDHVDGCAIFYKNDIFKPVLQHTVEYNRVACKVVDSCDNSENLINRIITKDNIGLLVMFELLQSPSKHVLIANAHLHWDPEFCDIKLVQTIILMDNLHKMRMAAVSEPQKLKEQAAEEKQRLEDAGGGVLGSTFNGAEIEDSILAQLPIKNLLGHHPDSIPVIVAGDFNSLPDSGVLEFVEQGSVYLKHKDWLGFGYPETLKNLELQKHWTKAQHNNPHNSRIETVQKAKNNLVHDLKLGSAYEDFKEKTPFSNFTYEFKGMIDYIFYSRKLLSLTGVLEGVERKWFEERNIPGAPFIGIPSDHLPLLSEFAFKKPGSQQTQSQNSATNNAQTNSGTQGSGGGGGAGGAGGQTPPARTGSFSISSNVNTGSWGQSSNASVPRNTWGNNVTNGTNGNGGGSSKINPLNW